MSKDNVSHINKLRNYINQKLQEQIQGLFQKDGNSTVSKYQYIPTIDISKFVPKANEKFKQDLKLRLLKIVESGKPSIIFNDEKLRGEAIYPIRFDSTIDPGAKGVPSALSVQNAIQTVESFAKKETEQKNLKFGGRAIYPRAYYLKNVLLGRLVFKYSPVKEVKKTEEVEKARPGLPQCAPNFECGGIDELEVRQKLTELGLKELIGKFDIELAEFVLGVPSEGTSQERLVKTIDAIMNFQVENKIRCDGCIGKKTVELMVQKSFKKETSEAGAGNKWYPIKVTPQQYNIGGFYRGLYGSKMPKDLINYLKAQGIDQKAQYRKTPFSRSLTNTPNVRNVPPPPKAGKVKRAPTVNRASKVPSINKLSSELDTLLQEGHIQIRSQLNFKLSQIKENQKKILQIREKIKKTRTGSGPRIKAPGTTIADWRYSSTGAIQHAPEENLKTSLWFRINSRNMEGLLNQAAKHIITVTGYHQKYYNELTQEYRNSIGMKKYGMKAWGSNGITSFNSKEWKYVSYKVLNDRYFERQKKYTRYKSSWWSEEKKEELKSWIKNKRFDQMYSYLISLLGPNDTSDSSFEKSDNSGYWRPWELTKLSQGDSSRLQRAHAELWKIAKAYQALSIAFSGTLENAYFQEWEPVSQNIEGDMMVYWNPSRDCVPDKNGQVYDPKCPNFNQIVDSEDFPSSQLTLKPQDSSELLKSDVIEWHPEVKIYSLLRKKGTSRKLCLRYLKALKTQNYYTPESIWEIGIHQVQPNEPHRLAEMVKVQVDPPGMTWFNRSWSIMVPAGFKLGNMPATETKQRISLTDAHWELKDSIVYKNLTLDQWLSKMLSQLNLSGAPGTRFSFENLTKNAITWHRNATVNSAQNTLDCFKKDPFSICYPDLSKDISGPVSFLCKRSIKGGRLSGQILKKLKKFSPCAMGNEIVDIRMDKAARELYIKKLGEYFKSQGLGLEFIRHVQPSYDRGPAEWTILPNISPETVTAVGELMQYDGCFKQWVEFCKKSGLDRKCSGESERRCKKFKFMKNVEGTGLDEYDIQKEIVAWKGSSGSKKHRSGGPCPYCNRHDNGLGIDGEIPCEYKWLEYYAELKQYGSIGEDRPLWWKAMETYDTTKWFLGSMILDPIIKGLKEVDDAAQDIVDGTWTTRQRIFRDYADNNSQRIDSEKLNLFLKDMMYYNFGTIKNHARTLNEIEQFMVENKYFKEIKLPKNKTENIRKIVYSTKQSRMFMQTLPAGFGYPTSTTLTLPYQSLDPCKEQKKPVKGGRGFDVLSPGRKNTDWGIMRSRPYANEVEEGIAREYYCYHPDGHEWTSTYGYKLDSRKVAPTEETCKKQYYSSSNDIPNSCFQFKNGRKSLKAKYQPSKEKRFIQTRKDNAKWVLITEEEFITSEKTKERCIKVETPWGQFPIRITSGSEKYAKADAEDFFKRLSYDEIMHLKSLSVRKLIQSVLVDEWQKYIDKKFDNLKENKSLLLENEDDKSYLKLPKIYSWASSKARENFFMGKDADCTDNDPKAACTMGDGIPNRNADTFEKGVYLLLKELGYMQGVGSRILIPYSRTKSRVDNFKRFEHKLLDINTATDIASFLPFFISKYTSVRNYSPEEGVPGIKDINYLFSEELIPISNRVRDTISTNSRFGKRDDARLLALYQKLGMTKQIRAGVFYQELSPYLSDPSPGESAPDSGTYSMDYYDTKTILKRWKRINSLGDLNEKKHILSLATFIGWEIIFYAGAKTIALLLGPTGLAIFSAAAANFIAHALVIGATVAMIWPHIDMIMQAIAPDEYNFTIISPQQVREELSFIDLKYRELINTVRESLKVEILNNFKQNWPDEAADEPCEIINFLSKEGYTLKATDDKDKSGIEKIEGFYRQIVGSSALLELTNGLQLINSASLLLVGKVNRQINILKQTFPESVEFFDTWNEKSADIQRIHLRMGNSVKVHMSGYYSDFNDLRGEYGKTGAAPTTVDKSALNLQKAKMLAAKLSEQKVIKK